MAIWFQVGRDGLPSALMVVMPLKLRLCMGQIYISCARYLNEPSTSSNPSKHYTVQSSLPFLNKPQTSNLLFYILRSSFARTHVDIVAKEKRIAFCLCPSAHLDYAPCTELCLTLPPSLVRALAQIIKHRLPFSFPFTPKLSSRGTTTNPFCSCTM